MGTWVGGVMGREKSGENPGESGKIQKKKRKIRENPKNEIEKQSREIRSWGLWWQILRKEWPNSSVELFCFILDW